MLFFMINTRLKNLEITPLDPREKGCRALIQDLDDYQVTLYPAESNHLDSIDELIKPHVHFLGALYEGNLVGCGAIKFCDTGDTYGEIKRMYVLPSARGMGVGREILHALETIAARQNHNIIRLETGISQPEALQLYEQCGYVKINPFGNYQQDPFSVFMEKRMSLF